MPRLQQTGESLDPVLSLDVKKILRGFIRYIWVIIALTVLGAVLGSYFYYILTQKSKAEAVLVYQQEGVQPDTAYQIIHLSMASAVEMATLPVHLKAVKSILGLEYSIEELQEMIKVEPPLRESNLFTISVVASKPALAIDIANTLAQVVVKSSQDMNREQWQKVYAYYANQNRELRAKLDEQVATLADYRQKNRFLGMDVTSSASLQDLRNAELELEKVKIEYTRYSAEYENLKHEYDKIPEKIAKPSIEDTTLSSQISQIESALLLARTKYAPSNPKIKNLEVQLIELKKQASAPAEPNEASAEYIPNPAREQLNVSLIEMRARMLSALRLKEELEKTVTELKSQVTNLSEQQLNFAQMMNMKMALEEKIRQTELKERQAETMVHLGKGDIEFYQKSEKAFSLESKKIYQILPFLGLFSGLFLGMTLVLILEVLDNKVRTSKQCELLFGIPCIATIPEIHSWTERWSDQKALFYARDLVDRLRSIKPSFKTVAVTSSVSGEGKSFVSHYLSQYFSRLGQSVLMLELDYRENSFLRSTANYTLDMYLRNQASYQDIIAHGPVDLIKVGRDPELHELINSNEMADLWTVLTNKYDKIIVEIPGALEEDSTSKFINACDFRLLVIGSSFVNQSYIKSSLDELKSRGVRITDIVLNRILPVYVDSVRIREHEQKSTTVKKKTAYAEEMGIEEKFPTEQEREVIS